MKKTMTVVAMVAILGAAGSAYAGLVAYNDLVYPDTGGTAETNVRINYYTTGIVPSREPFTLNNEGNSGPLTDYYTELESDVTVTILSSGTELWRMWYYDDGFWYGGMNAPEGTPAHDVFCVWGGYHGIETRGALYPTEDIGMAVSYAFTGLNVDSDYELVAYAGWSKVEYPPPIGSVRLEIHGDNGSTNTTPAGNCVVVLDDHTTVVASTYNGYVDGDIASWIVTPNPSGFFQLVASHPAGGGGAFPPQVFRLVEIESVVPEPAGLGLIALSLLAVRKRRR